MLKKIKNLFKKEPFSIPTPPMDERWKAVFVEAKTREFKRPGS